MEEYLPVEKKRKLVVLNSIFMKIQKTLEGSIGESAAKVLHSAGKEFGQKYMEIVENENEEATIQDLLIELEMTGFVKAEFNPDNKSFEVTDSPIASSYKESDVPVCHFLTGFFEGLVSEFYENPGIQYTETVCKATGKKKCVFEIKKE
jgi:predicted hydrocarbon binding protein